MAKNITSTDALLEDFNFPRVNGMTVEENKGKEKAPVKKTESRPELPEITEKSSAADNALPWDKPKKEKQTVKLAFYLTPRIVEAMNTYKAVRMIFSDRVNSKIANQAFEEFFEKELKILDSLDPKLSENQRIDMAARQIRDSMEP